MTQLRKLDATTEQQEQSCHHLLAHAFYDQSQNHNPYKDAHVGSMRQ